MSQRNGLHICIDSSSVAALLPGIDAKKQSLTVISGFSIIQRLANSLNRYFLEQE